MTTTSAPEAPAHWLVAFTLTFLAYVVAGVVALTLAIPPGYATPLYPAAGVAVTSVLLFGPRMLPAVAAGAFLVALRTALGHGQPGLSAVLLALCVAGGGALQAFLGARLIQRHVKQPLLLSEPRDIAGLLAAGMASCLASALLGAAGLWVTKAVHTSHLPLNMATWWVGDLLGVLIATPVLLTLFGRPREAWAPRRLSVGLTLTLATALLALGIRQVVSWSNERVHTGFDRDAASTSLALASQLQQPLNALEALRGVFITSNTVSRQDIRVATQAWLEAGTLQAMGWSERVSRADIPSLEAKARSEGSERFTVFDRSDAPPVRSEDAMAMRYVEPLLGNSTALGVNMMSIPAAKHAINLARRSDKPAASAGFALTQSLPDGDKSSVVIFRAIYQPLSPSLDQRMTSTRGVVFVALRPSEHLKGLITQVPAHLHVCVVDTTPGDIPQRLAGAPDCDTESFALQHVRQLDFAGRLWELRVQSHAEDLPEARSADVWLFALVGLLSTAMLGGFLLIVTGRTRRIETAVRDRTAALESEVHDRQVAEAALRESEQKFRNILSSVPIGVVYTDLTRQVRQTNPRYCELTGYSEAELLSMNLFDYTHPDDVPQDLELMTQLVHGEIPMYRRNKRFITKQGDTVSVQATVSLLRDANGNPKSIVAVVEDITEHLRLKEAEHAREAAEASNRTKSEFLSRMSHELRTPLNAMLGFAQLLELDPRHPLTAAQRPWVSQIQQAGWHLLEMINDVLDLSRIESGNLRLQTETLNLVELIEASVAMVEGEARQRQIQMSRHIDEGTNTLLGDSTRVKQILTNLLSNAVKYNVAGGSIHIACRMSSNDEVEVSVTDTGMGLSPLQLSELFQPFNRLGRERSNQEGTGIGLVISQRLAELMGGSLRARSIEGQGSSFILRLPCSADPDTVRSELDALAPEPATYARCLVHYVEDNETNIEVMRGILAQRPQIELQTSMLGMEGLAAIRATPPDLILLDMHLPDMTGMDVLRHLKADVRTAGVPVVVVSADALAQQIDEAFGAGCAHYLTKPVSVSELLTVVDDLLSKLQPRYL